MSLTMTRRAFALGVGALATMPIFGRDRERVPLLRFGVVSDVHITHRGRPTDRYQYGSAQTFVNALSFFKRRGVEAVVLPGDMADRGLLANLNVVAAAWEEVFADDRVERLFIYGNHDADAQWFEKSSGLLTGKSDEERARLVSSCIASRPAESWRIAFGEEWMPISLRTIAGFRFVLCNWGYEDQVPAFLEAHREELAGPRPFFYVQHPHLRGTLYGGRYQGGADQGVVNAALARFPHAITLTGHSHVSLTVPGSWSRGNFISIGASSLSYLSKYGRPAGSSREGREGMIISVYDEELVVERREFVDNILLGEDWHIPLIASCK